MSRIGRKSISLPMNTTLTVEGGTVAVKGPKGSLIYTLLPGMTVDQTEGKVQVKVEGKAASPAVWGLTRSLINNMIHGVTEGWEQRLELVGAGYRAKLEGGKLTLTVGFSHPVVINQPEGITFSVEGNNKIIVQGIDRQAVGQIAATIRGVRPPEPYKGKGIRYEGERVRHKAGKTAKAAGAPGGAA